MFWSESKDIRTLCDLYLFNTMEGFFLQNVKLFLFHQQAKKCNGVFNSTWQNHIYSGLFWDNSLFKPAYFVSSMNIPFNIP